MSDVFKVHVKDAAVGDRSAARECVHEYASLEDALFQAFLMLDAGESVASITGPDVDFNRDQIKRKWRAARQ